MLDTLDGLSIPDKSFWLICAAFYLVDNVRLHGGRELLLAESLIFRWRLLFPLQHYRLGGRAVTLLPPWLPFLAVVRLSWLSHDAFSATRLRRTKRLLRFYRQCLAPFRVLASFYFLILFIVGPIATHYAGLGYAIILVVPLHVAGLSSLIAFLLMGRRALRMNWSQLIGLVFECAVCPGYFVNICRKLSIGYIRVSADAIALALEEDRPRVLASLGINGIDMLLDDLAENDELRPDDSASIAIYRDHLDLSDSHA